MISTEISKIQDYNCLISLGSYNIFLQLLFDLKLIFYFILTAESTEGSLVFSSTKFALLRVIHNPTLIQNSENKKFDTRMNCFK